LAPWRCEQQLPEQWHLRATPPPAASARFVAVIQVSRRGFDFPPVWAGKNSFEVAGYKIRIGDQRLMVSAAR
jgi:hypothetical protein